MGWQLVASVLGWTLTHQYQGQTLIRGELDRNKLDLNHSIPWSTIAHLPYRLSLQVEDKEYSVAIPWVFCIDQVFISDLWIQGYNYSTFG